MSNKQRYCGQFLTYVCFQNLCKSKRKATSFRETWRKHILMVPRCGRSYCELANRTTQQLYKVATPCLDDHQFKEEELGSAGELSKVCSEIGVKCIYLARIGGPDRHSMVCEQTCTYLFRFLLFFCKNTFSSPLFSCPALSSPTHMHTNNRHNTDTTDSTIRHTTPRACLSLFLWFSFSFFGRIQSRCSLFV